MPRREPPEITQLKDENAHHSNRSEIWLKRSGRVLVGSAIVGMIVPAALEIFGVLSFSPIYTLLAIVGIGCIAAMVLLKFSDWHRKKSSNAHSRLMDMYDTLHKKGGNRRGMMSFLTGRLLQPIF